MQKAVDRFNDDYYDDLAYLEFSDLDCLSDGKVDISEISTLDCLKEAFLRLVKCEAEGYKIKFDNEGYCYLED
jgi:hypothetical protein